MRRWLAIAWATALEILSEPLSLLLLLSAETLMTLAPACHYHQFGEPTRMARDAGFSALFLFGSLLAVFGIMRSFRREIESGTMEMAFAHAVSRKLFFLAKVSGAVIVVASFLAIALATMLLMVEGASVGWAVAGRTGDQSIRIYGPFLAAAIALLLLPIVIAGALSFFARCRFVLTSFVIGFSMSVVAICAVCWLDLRLVTGYLPALMPVIALTIALLTAAAAFSVRLRSNAALASVGVVVAVALPVIGNFYLSDSLSGGGCVGWGYAAAAFGAVLPAVAAFSLLGIHWLERDVNA